MPGSRQGVDRFKAAGLMQSGMTHVIDQSYSLTYRVDAFWRDHPTPAPVFSQPRQGEYTSVFATLGCRQLEIYTQPLIPQEGDA